MSRIITTVALVCVAIAIGMAAVKWNESSPTSAQNPMLTPQNPMLTPQNPIAPGTTANTGGAPGQAAVIQQQLPAANNGVPLNTGVPPAGTALSPTPVLTPGRPAYGPMQTPQETVATTRVVEPEKVIVEKRVVYVRPRNRVHIGRTLYETAHHVLNLPNRLLGP